HNAAVAGPLQGRLALVSPRAFPAFLLVVAGAATACGTAQKPREIAARAAIAPSTAPAATSAEPPSLPTPAPVLVVSDPVVLRELEQSGFDFGSTVVGARAASTKELAQNAGYRTLTDAVIADLAADRRGDASAGVGIRFSHRQFDIRWL